MPEDQFETEDDYDLQALRVGLFHSLLEEQDSHVLEPVASGIRAYFHLLGILNKNSNEGWFTSVSSPFVDFQRPSLSIQMNCPQGIRLSLTAVNDGLLKYSCQVWLDRPDVPPARSFSDNIYAEPEELPYIVSAIFSALQRNKLPYKEAIAIGEETRKKRRETWKLYESLKAELILALQAIDQPHFFTDPKMELTDRHLMITSTLIAHLGNRPINEEVCASLEITVYSDGLTRLEHDRRDVSSPDAAVKLMKECIAEGERLPGLDAGNS